MTEECRYGFVDHDFRIGLELPGSDVWSFLKGFIARRRHRKEVAVHIEALKAERDSLFEEQVLYLSLQALKSAESIGESIMEIDFHIERYRDEGYKV